MRLIIIIGIIHNICSMGRKIFLKEIYYSLFTKNKRHINYGIAKDDH